MVRGSCVTALGEASVVLSVICVRELLRCCLLLQLTDRMLCFEPYRTLDRFVAGCTLFSSDHFRRAEQLV